MRWDIQCKKYRIIKELGVEITGQAIILGINKKKIKLTCESVHVY